MPSDPEAARFLGRLVGFPRQRRSQNCQRLPCRNQRCQLRRGQAHGTRCGSPGCKGATKASDNSSSGGGVEREHCAYLDPKAVGISAPDTDTKKSWPFSNRSTSVSFSESNPALQADTATEVHLFQMQGEGRGRVVPHKASSCGPNQHLERDVRALPRRQQTIRGLDPQPRPTEGPLFELGHKPEHGVHLGTPAPGRRQSHSNHQSPISRL